ncbi:MAG: arylsulfatase [Cyclobacteriaceae bacterium]
MMGLVLLSCHKKGTDSERPNFVIIMADDLGYADIGSYGATIIETPNIDSIANRGIKFKNFSNTAKCHVSRVSLISGLWCDQAGNSSLKNATPFPMVLKDAGYFTGMAGKWHLYKNPLDWGFEKYFGHLSGFSDYVGGNGSFRMGREKYDEFGETTEDFYTTDAMTDYAIEFISDWKQQEDSKPFALYIAYNAPHSPLQAPKKLIEKYRGKFMKGWEYNQSQRFARQKEIGLFDEGVELPQWPDHHRNWHGLSHLDKSWEDYRRAIYAAMVESLDQNIGRLKSELIRTGEWDNTVFVFLSDNGSDAREINRKPYGKPWEKGFHVQVGTEWAGVGNTPFRWYKESQHEGGISTPFIVSWPNGLKMNGWADFRAHIVDVYPTLLELAGHPYPKSFNGRNTIPLEGESLVKVFNTPDCDRVKPIFLKYVSNKGIIQGDYKLVSSRKGPWELYNLDTDPTEQNDLSSLMPDRVERMKEEFSVFLQKNELSQKEANVNDYIAPWGIRSYTNSERKHLKEGDPNPSEVGPVWSGVPAMPLNKKGI